MDVRPIALSLFMMIITTIALGVTGASLSMDQESNRTYKLYLYTQEYTSAKRSADEVNDKLEQALTVSRQLLDRAEDNPDDYKHGTSRGVIEGRSH